MNTFRSTFLWVLTLLAGPAWAGVIETGADDFRLTNFGPAGDTFAFAARQDVVYNATDNEYFVIFLGRRPEAPTSSDEFEVYGLRLTTAGSPIGEPTLLTNVGGLGVAGGTPQNRRIAYDPARNGYVLVYDAQDSEFGAASLDVYARLISASGQPVGPAFVVDDEATSDVRPDVAVNTVSGEFLVVWVRIGEVSTERTIRARRFAASTGQALGSAFRIDTIDQVKGNATVAYNSDDNQYLVAWANNTRPPQIQVLSADGTGQLSQEVEYATAGFYTSRSEIVYNPDLGEYLIVFAQSDPGQGMVAESFEMFGRRISSAGAPLGSGKFKLSLSDFADRFTRSGTNIDCNPGGQCLEAGRPGVAYVSQEQSYVVAWSGTLEVRLDGDREVFVRAFKAGIDPASTPDQTQISNMGGDDINYLGLLPSVAASPDGVLALWWGDDNVNGGVDNEFEIWGQNLLLNVFRDGFEEVSP